MLRALALFVSELLFHDGQMSLSDDSLTTASQDTGRPWSDAGQLLNCGGLSTILNIQTTSRSERY